MSALRSEARGLLTDRARCECGARLYMKLSRDDRGGVRREWYCANHLAHVGVDVTNTAGRRALKLAAAARELAQGAA